MMKPDGVWMCDWGFEMHDEGGMGGASERRGG